MDRTLSVRVHADRAPPVRSHGRAFPACVRRSRARALIACVLLLCGGSAASAQHSLVLSGGGARGLSHAGAIVALEELGYRPALVAGTSMGAIVGALYAAGYSADEIRAIVARENWLERFAAEPLLVGPRREPRRALLGFGIGRGRFFGGFIPETGINQRLIELLFDAGVRARNDFDALPIRYRAIAADLADGSLVVLGSGDLPRAVRASMAVPGMFAPVRWGERVLIDGGIADNLPVAVARALSERPVIAVDVLSPAESLDERGALDLGVRALRLLIGNARPKENAEADVLVRPRIEPGFSEGYFPADASGLIRAGYGATIEQAPAVAQQPEARREPGAPPERITALRVDNANVATDRLIRRIMAPAVREYDADDIVQRTNALHMTGLFQSVWPRVERSGDEATLIVDVTRVAATSLAGAARWDNDVGAGAWLLLRQHVDLRTPVELRLAGRFDQLGTAGSLDASFFSALVPGLTWNGGAHAAEQRVRIFDPDGEILERPFSRRAGAWLGAELHGSIGEWYISLLGRADHVRDPLVEGWAIGPFLRVARTPAADRVVGVEPLLETEVRGGDIEYQRITVMYGPALRAQRLRVAPVIAYESASRATPLISLPASRLDLAPWNAAGELRARQLAAAGVDVALPILLNGYARVRLRAAAAAPQLDELLETGAWTAGAEVGTVWPTVLGPIGIGLAAGHRGQRRLNIELGARF
jgi:predicted acylesterase/phospholipase RssA